MTFKDSGIQETPLTYEQAEAVLSETIIGLKDLTISQRIRDPDRDKVRIERYRVLIDLCMGYCYLQIFHEILKLRSELNGITNGGSS